MRTKIEFLEKMFKRLNNRFEILSFLKENRIITDDEMQALLNEHHTSHPTRVASLLDQLQQSEKVQLVNYEWTVLPKEFMQLSIVTDEAKREFTYTV